MAQFTRKDFMRDLTTANKLLANFAKKNKYFTPITLDDAPLFQHFFETYPASYSNSLSYILQGMYGVGRQGLGYKYYDQENIAAVCIYPRIENADTYSFFWVRPMGQSILPILTEYSHTIHKELNIPIYAKKLYPQQYDYLLKKGFQNVVHYPWHTNIPSEDDSYPEQILNISRTIELAKKFGKKRRLNKAYRNYLNLSTKTSFLPLFENQKLAWYITNQFFSSHLRKSTCNVSAPEDYYNLIYFKPAHTDVFSEIIKIEEQPIGYYYIVRQNANHAALYATITLREYSNTIVDFVMFHIFDILIENGVKFLNLGGSESSSLHEFKQKFKPVSEQKMYWAVLAPSN